MKRPVKKIISHLLMFALVLCVAIAPSLAESKPDCLQTISGKNGTTYSNLFDVILSDDYDSVWEEHCKAIVGEENAAEAVEMLKSFISGDVYGDDAVALYGDGSEGFIFDCWYLNDVKSFTMNGDEITINKLDGTSETHKYRCIGTYQIGADETMTWAARRSARRLTARCIRRLTTRATSPTSSSATTRWKRPTTSSSAMAAIWRRFSST